MKTDRKTQAKPDPEATELKKPRRSRTKSSPGTNGKSPLVSYEHAPIGIVECSPDGNHINANEEFCRFLGYEKEEIVGKDLKSITHEDDYPIDIKLHQQLVEGKIPFYRLEKRYLRKDGGAVWAELTRTVVRDSDGKALYTIGVVLDISDRKHVERVLRDSSERLRLATEAARMFMWELDISNRVYTFADNFKQVLGFSDGLLPKNTAEAVERLSPPEDVRAFWDSLANAMERHSDLFSQQFRMINPTDHQVVWLEVSAKIVYNEDGIAERMFGVAQNITQNKHAEELERSAAANLLAIAEANAKFRAFFDQGSYFAGVMTLDGTLIEANRLSLEFCGFQREEVIGKKFWNCGWWSPSPVLMEMIRRGTAQAAEGKLFRQESSYFLADKSERFVDLIIAPVKNEMGQVLFLAPTGTDITERKLAEEKLSQQAEILELAPVIIRDLDSCIVSWSKGVEQMYGWTKEEAIGKLSHELFQTKFPVSFEDTQEKLLTNGEWEGELEHVKRDGTRLIVLSHQVIHRDAAGTPVAILENNTDITQRKHIERELAHERELLERLFEAIPVMLTVYEPSTELLRLNSQFERLTGWNNQEAVGISLMEACYPDPGYREQVWEYMNTCAEDEWMDIHMQTRDGRTLETSWSNLRLSDNMQVGIGIDISERKRTEQALKEFARQQESLYQFTDQLQHTNSVEDIFNAALDAILSGLPCDRASILLFDDQDVMSFVAWRGLSNHYRSATNGHSPWTPEAIDPEPICMNHVDTADLTDSLRATIKGEGIGALAFIPLVSNGKLIGKFMTYYNAPHVFDQDEIDLSLTIARQLAFSIDRRRADEALRASEEKYRRIVETANEGIWEIDRETRTTFVNAHMAEMLGYRLDEMVGRSSFDFVFPEDNGEGEQRLARVRQGDQTESSEFRFRRKDGSALWALVSSSPQLDEQGNFLGSIAMIVDITERKRIEQELTRERQLLELLFETMPVMVSMYDPRTNSLRLNAEFERRMGWKTGELNVVSLLESIYPDPNYRTQVIERMMEAGRNDWVEVQVQTRDGRTLDSIWSNISILNGRQIGIGIDITERKRAEEALQASEQRFREIFETAGVSVWLEDFTQVQAKLKELRAQGVDDFRTYFLKHPDFVHDTIDLVHILDVNNETLDLFGVRDKTELLGSLSNVFAPETAHIFVEELMALAEGRETLRAETQVRALDGKPISVLFTVHFAPPNNNQSHVVVTLTDITERKHAEEALRVENERFMRFFDSNIVGILIGNTEGKVMLANDYYLNLLGVNRQDFEEGRVDWRMFTPPEWLPADEKAIQQLYEHGICEPYEKEYIREDGTRVPVYVANAMLPGPKEEIAAFVLDLTERKRAEEQLRRSAEFDAFRVSLTDALRPLSDPGEILTEALRLLGEHFQVDRVLYSEIEDDDETILILDNYVKEGIPKLTGRASLNDYGKARGSLSEGQNLIIVDAASSADMDETDRASFAALGIRSGIGIPLIKNGRWVATLGIHHSTVRTWKQDEITFLEETAERIWSAIERARFQEALRESETLYRTIARSIPGGGVYVVDEDMRYIVADGAVTKAFDLSREILEGHTVAEVFHGEQRARMIDRLNQNFAGETLSYETEYNGRVFWTQQAPLQESIGQAIIVTLDITERKRAEEALQESEERFRAILRQATAGIVRKDAKGRLVFVNQAFCNMLGYTEAELLGKTVWDFMHPDDVAENKSSFDHLLFEGVPFKVERRFLRQDGSVIWVDASVSPITDSTGKPQSAVAVEVDITARKRAEAALQQLNLQLENRVQARTAELQATNKFLQDEIRERRQVELALDESRKRLQILSQRLVEVQEEERRAIARELHDRVGQTLSALNINMIIMRDQLLPDSLERVGPRLSDSMHLVGETITLVRDVMSNLRPAVLDDYGLEAALQSHADEFTARYGITIHFRKPAQPLPRLGSSVEMTFLRIAQEALINIARHANASQVILSLWQEADSVYMTIQDNGSGIASWQQANRPGSHGLVIMRERAEAFGGNLNVASVPGKGTTVKMSIPIGKGSQPEVQQEMLK